VLYTYIKTIVEVSTPTEFDNIKELL
jgi:hypothetical protein